MATIYDIKPKFQGLLRPLVVRLAAAGVTANHVTLGAAALSVLYGALLLVWGGSPVLLLGLPVILFLRMGLNAIDGMLAREHGQESRLGFFLNEIFDVVSDTALYLPLMLVLDPGQALLAGAATVAFALTEFAGVLGRAAGGARRYDGPFGKSDRAAAFSVVAVVAALFSLSAGVFSAVFAIALVLSVLTVANRVRASLAEVSR